MTPLDTFMVSLSEKEKRFLLTSSIKKLFEETE